MRALARLLVVLLAVGAAHAAVAWPLRVSSNGRYLEDQNGVPFLIVGDAPWEMQTSLTLSQMDTYFNRMETLRINAVLIEAIDPTLGVNAPNDMETDTAPFAGGMSNWASPNSAYWGTLDSLLAKAKAKDILVFLFPAYLGYQCSSSPDEGVCGEMVSQTNTAMTNYGEFIGNRYASQGNIIWVDGGDADADLYTNVTARVTALKDGTEGVDSQHLRTGHSDRGLSAADTYTWSEIYSAYGDCETMAEETKVEWDRVSVKPVFMIEGRYDDLVGSDCLASQALHSFLGGAMGSVYGDETVWDFDTGWDGTGGITSGDYDQQANIGDLMRSRAWWRLVPDWGSGIVTSARGSRTAGTYVSVARTSDGETVMVYLPEDVNVTVDMTEIAGTTARAWWFVPSTGATTDLGTFATTGTQEFNPPGTVRVLVLDNDAEGLPAPGSADYSLDEFVTGKIRGVSMSGGSIR